MPRALLWGVLAISVVACGRGQALTDVSTVEASRPTITTVASTTTTIAPTTTTRAPSTTSPATTSTVTLPPGFTLADGVPEAAIFLAAVERGMAGTGYEGDAYEDPKGFLATGVLFCELLEDGLGADEVLLAYAAALSEGGDVPPEDLHLGAVVLGASIGVLCPEFSHLLEPDP